MVLLCMLVPHTSEAKLGMGMSLGGTEPAGGLVAIEPSAGWGIGGGLRGLKLSARILVPARSEVGAGAAAATAKQLAGVVWWSMRSVGDGTRSSTRMTKTESGSMIGLGLLEVLSLFCC